VMKVAGPEQDEPRPVAVTQLAGNLVRERPEGAEAATHADARAPGSQIGDRCRRTVTEAALRRQAAVQVEDLQSEAGRARPGIVRRANPPADRRSPGAFA